MRIEFYSSQMAEKKKHGGHGGLKSTSWSRAKKKLAHSGAETKMSKFSEIIRA